MDQAPDIGAQHAHLLRLVQQERLALLAGEIALARDLLAEMHALQETHIADEESRLLPRLPQTARWPARIYIAEHRKLTSMLADLRATLAPLAARRPHRGWRHAAEFAGCADAFQACDRAPFRA